MKLVSCLVFVLLASAADAAKKKKKSKSKKKSSTPAPGPAVDVPELSQCAACEDMGSDMTAFVRGAVRERLHPKEESKVVSEGGEAEEADGEPPQEITWEMRMSAACTPKRMPWCEQWKHRWPEAIEELKDFADNADSMKDSNIDKLSITKYMCAHDAPFGACHRNHNFKKRSNPHACDVVFRNTLNKEVRAYWIEPGADMSREATMKKSFKGSIKKHGELKEDSSKGHRYAFIVDGLPWEDHLEVTVPKGPFAAFSIEKNPTYDPDMKAFVRAKGSKKPDNWDDDEDGPWEPLLKANPKFKTNTKYHLRHVSEQEL